MNQLCHGLCLLLCDNALVDACVLVSYMQMDHGITIKFEYYFIGGFGSVCKMLHNLSADNQKQERKVCMSCKMLPMNLN